MKKSLKPQDVVVLVKLCGVGVGSRPPYSVIASELSMSQSEVNSSVKRLQAAKLIHDKEMNEQPILSAVEEFLVHAVKYVFPASRGHVVRGMPTAHAAEPLKSKIVVSDELAPVWPDPKGMVRGLSLSPLYPTVPYAAKLDPILYERLALIDAIRDGNARERKLAESILKKSLKAKNNG